MRIAFIALTALCLHAADLKLGKPLTLKEPIAVDTLLEKAQDHVGKTVQVKGKITEVCQMMGCWMSLVGDSGKSVRIKVHDGEIEFPKDGAGRMAIAEGKLTKIEMTREQAIAAAKHQAEEMGRKFNPDSVKGPVVMYQIAGTGAVIQSN